MRTIRTKVYKFEELVVDAQANAIEQYRNNSVEDFSWIYDECHKTIKAFNELFKTKEGRDSFLDVNTNHIDDDILELNGLRLHKYILNNYYTSLFKNTYIKNGGIVETKPIVSHPMRRYNLLTSGPNKGKYLVSYYSSFKKDNSCALTGVCYDDAMLQPIYDFLKYPSDTTFEELIGECFKAIAKSLSDEIDYQDSDECIRENLIENDYEFLRSGQKFAI